MTSFPEPIGLGASFNMSMVHEMAQIIATEARALFNTGQYPPIGGGIGGLTFFSPNVRLLSIHYLHPTDQHLP